MLQRASGEPRVAHTATAEPWGRVRAGLAFPDVCDTKPQTRRWARIYAHDPDRLTEELRRFAPQIDFIHDVLALRGVPSDFALLPWVESRFQAGPAGIARPAGMWQFMPVTAREFGLAIGPDYDGRLDLYAATLAATSLLEHLGKAFDGDWRIACMAYNAGEFRVRRALRRRGVDASARVVENLPLNPITHAHLAKLEALGCLIRHPDRYGIVLPSMPSDARLRVVALPGPIDRDLARALTGIDQAEFSRLNPALRTPLLPAGRHLVLPQSALPRWQRLVAALPPAAATRDWRAAADFDRNDIDAAARRAQIDPAWLAALHTDDAEHRRSRATLLPQGVHRNTRGKHTRYQVRSGDSAWTIARRLGVRLEALLNANGLDRHSILRPGQWLRIPD